MSRLDDVQAAHDGAGVEGVWEGVRVLLSPNVGIEHAAIPGLVANTRALEEIATKQPEMLETLRRHGVVFDGPLGNDPKNWQHVAFSIYTRLCEVDSIARAALAEFEAGP